MVDVRHYTNTATEATLTSGITAADVTFSLTSFADYPAAPFTAAISRGETDEEIVLVTVVSGTTVTVTRGYDGTTAKSHDAGATFLHVVVAKDYTEANTHNTSVASAHGTTSPLVGTSDTQTLTNKTLVAPVLQSPTGTGTAQFASMTLSGSLTVAGAVALSGLLTAGAGLVVPAGQSTTVDALTAATADVTGDATVGGDATIVGGATVGGTLSVTGAITATGGVSGALTVPTGKAATITDAPASPTDAVNRAYTDALGDSAATANKLVRRDASGRAQFVDPATDADAATKGYTDTGDGRLISVHTATATAVSPTDGSHAKVAGLGTTATLTAGRRYQVTGRGRTSNASVAGRTGWYAKVAAGSSTTTGAQIVASVVTVHPYSGGAGQQDVTFSGEFAVSSTGTYTLDAWLSGSSPTQGAIVPDNRGRYDFVFEDCGPIGSVTDLLTI